eukprot:EG_transcript_36098
MKYKWMQPSELTILLCSLHHFFGVAFLEWQNFSKSSLAEKVQAPGELLKEFTCNLQLFFAFFCIFFASPNLYHNPIPISNSSGNPEETTNPIPWRQSISGVGHAKKCMLRSGAVPSCLARYLTPLQT